MDTQLEIDRLQDVVDAINGQIEVLKQGIADEYLSSVLNSISKWTIELSESPRCHRINGRKGIKSPSFDAKIFNARVYVREDSVSIYVPDEDLRKVLHLLGYVLISSTSVGLIEMAKKKLERLNKAVAEVEAHNQE